MGPVHGSWLACLPADDNVKSHASDERRLYGRRAPRPGTSDKATEGDVTEPGPAHPLARARDLRGRRPQHLPSEGPVPDAFAGSSLGGRHVCRAAGVPRHREPAATL